MAGGSLFLKRSIFAIGPIMGFGPDQLRDKALLALEEAVQDCRYGTPRRTIALRFALAYLWTYAPRDRAPFDEFWRALGQQKSPWSLSVADNALLFIYRALNVERDDEIGMRMWRRRAAEEKGK